MAHVGMVVAEMKLLIRAALSGLLVFALLCAGAMLIGQSNPTQPDLFKYLSMCDGLPCYLGIVPGKTSWDDAIAIFEDRLDWRFDPDIPEIAAASNPMGFQGRAVLYPSDQNSTIAKIQLSMPSPDITIGTLVHQMGSPCGIYSLAGMTTVLYPRMSIDVDIDQNAKQPLKVTSLPIIIELFAEYNSCDRYDELYGSYFQHWHGFTSYTN